MNVISPRTSCGGGWVPTDMLREIFRLQHCAAQRRVIRQKLVSVLVEDKHVSGDFPIAALSGTKKKFNSLQNLSATKNFVLIQYNVHSLINFEERMQRVLQEFEGRHWDAVAFSETWRSECDEAWKTRWGHFVVWKCWNTRYKRSGNSLAQSLDPRSIQTSLREIVRVGCEADE